MFFEIIADSPGKDVANAEVCDGNGNQFRLAVPEENERLNFNDFPSDSLIHRLAYALEADGEELLIMAKRIQEPVEKCFLWLLDLFRCVPSLLRRSRLILLVD